MPAIASYLTPPEIAKRFGVDPSKVRTWITSGVLPAIDVSTTGGGRPRYRISESDLQAFLASRSAGPQPKIARQRRRKQHPWTEYF